MATREQVERKLRELIDRLDRNQEGASSLKETLPEARTLVVEVTDLDLTYWAKLADGRLGELNVGEPERTDIRMRAASGDIVDLVDGRRSMFSAYMGGHIRIEAGLSDLLRLRKLAG